MFGLPEYELWLEEQDQQGIEFPAVPPRFLSLVVAPEAGGVFNLPHSDFSAICPAYRPLLPAESWQIVCDADHEAAWATGTHVLRNVRAGFDTQAKNV